MLNSINWNNFINPKYWLEGISGGAGSALVTPVLPINSQFYWFFLYLFSGLIISACFLQLVKIFLNPNNPIVPRLPFIINNYTWMGIIGFFWFISRQLSIAFLGGRFWLLLLLFWGLFIGFFTLKYMLKFYPMEMKYYRQSKRELKKEKKSHI